MMLRRRLMMFDEIIKPPVIFDEVVVTTTGASTWTVPADCKLVSVCVVAAGQNGAKAASSASGKGGDGGEVKNYYDIPVVEGSVLNLYVGSANGDATTGRTYFKDATYVANVSGTPGGASKGGNASGNDGVAGTYPFGDTAYGIMGSSGGSGGATSLGIVHYGGGDGGSGAGNGGKSNNNPAATAAATYGSGGGGGGRSGSTYCDGAAGKQGVIIVRPSDGYTVNFVTNPGATITFGNDTFVADSYGKVSFVKSAGTYTYTVSQNGYSSVSDTVSLVDKVTKINVDLELIGEYVITSTSSWVVPEGVTYVDVCVVCSGTSGEYGWFPGESDDYPNGKNGNGGHGGQVNNYYNVSVTPGETIPITIGPVKDYSSYSASDNYSQFKNASYKASGKRTTGNGQTGVRPFNDTQYAIVGSSGGMGGGYLGGIGAGNGGTGSNTGNPATNYGCGGGGGGFSSSAYGKGGAGKNGVVIILPKRV